MKSISLFLLLLLPAFSYAQSSSVLSKKGVTVCGKVRLENNASKVISLSYSQLSVSPTRLTSVLDSTGHFQFDFELIHGQNVLLKYESGLAELYVKPSDSLFITLNASDFKKDAYPTFVASGTNVKTTQNMLAYRRAGNGRAFKPKPEGKTVATYLGELRKQINSEDSLLTDFINHHPTTEEFRIWARKDNLYRNANFLVDFEAFQAMHGIPFSGELYDTGMFPVNDDSALITSWYHYHLWQYALSKYARTDPAIQILFKQQHWGEAYTSILRKVISNESKSVSRDVISYQLLYAISERDQAAFRSISDNLSRFIDSKILLSLLQERKVQIEKGRQFDIALYENESKAEKEILGDFMNDIIAKNKGKVIYFDIWATWCGPCRSEVPYAIDLEDQFKGKDIAFVNLCLASEREAWKTAIEKQKIPGENYFFDKDQSSLLTQKLKIAGFPTYMIIDKRGQIFTEQAPRPSSGEAIKSLLTSLLE